MDDTIKYAERNQRKYVCAFADDVTFATNKKYLKNNLLIWKESLKQYSMEINLSKNKIMVVSNKSLKINIERENKKLQQVEEFKSLGVVTNGNGGPEMEFDNTIKNTTNLCHALKAAFINKKEISRKTKITIYTTNNKKTNKFEKHTAKIRNEIFTNNSRRHLERSCKKR